jgi:hypothetical protein
LSPRQKERDEQWLVKEVLKHSKSVASMRATGHAYQGDEFIKEEVKI